MRWGASAGASTASLEPEGLPGCARGRQAPDAGDVVSAHPLAEGLPPPGQRTPTCEVGRCRHPRRRVERMTGDLTRDAELILHLPRDPHPVVDWWIGRGEG